MRSSSGSYLSNLDHLRVLAAFQVFVWHFVHMSATCTSICFAHDYHPGALSIFEEGHTGVSLFMCISGYVFAKLTDGKEIRTGQFWLNRAIRLLPLLAIWSAITLATAMVIDGVTLSQVWESIRESGSLHTVIPQGGWSVMLEMQFYLLFPFMLLFVRRFGNEWIVALLVLIVTLRLLYWMKYGSVQYISYGTLGGRIDQLLIGYLAFHFTSRYIVAIGAAGTVLLVWSYAAFDARGGFWGIDGYPSRNVLWVFWPLLEAICYSTMIAAYATLKLPRMLDTALAKAGTWSYSIYLGQFFFIPVIFFLIASWFGMPESFGGRFAWAAAAFLPLIGMSAITYTTIEKPFLGLRRNYLVNARLLPVVAPTSS
jgi:peptidoglycan/LPS O-acetylase OafA/YrhL